MRLLTVLGAYVAAALAGMISFVGYLTAADGWLGDFTVIVAMGAFAFGFAGAAPIALPVILTTELRESGPWWVFTGAGVIAGLLIASLFGPDAELAPFLLGAACCALAGFTYWLIAWRLYPPKAITNGALTSTE